MTASTDVQTDLSDLDSLNDPPHAYCRLCLPGGPREVRPGERFPTLCGKTSFAWTGDIGDLLTPPPNPCPKCMDVLWDACPRCGNVPKVPS